MGHEASRLFSGAPLTLPTSPSAHQARSSPNAVLSGFDRGFSTEAAVIKSRAWWSIQPSQKLPPSYRCFHTITINLAACGKKLILNNKAPISPLWFWSGFRHWGRKTNYYYKRHSHHSYCSGYPKESGTTVKTNYAFFPDHSIPKKKTTKNLKMSCLLFNIKSYRN